MGIPGFHPSVVRWCLMHVCHLGLLFVCNGSSMWLVEDKNIFIVLYYFGFWPLLFCRWLGSSPVVWQSKEFVATCWVVWQ